MVGAEIDYPVNEDVVEFRDDPGCVDGVLALDLTDTRGDRFSARWNNSVPPQNADQAMFVSLVESAGICCHTRASTALRRTSWRTCSRRY